MNLISLYTFKFSLKFNIIVLSIYHKHIIYVLHNFFLLSFSSDDQFATFSHCSNKSKKNVMKNIFQTRHKKRKFFNNKKKKMKKRNSKTIQRFLLSHWLSHIIMLWSLLYVCINLNIINYAKSTHNNNTRIFLFLQRGVDFQGKIKFLFFDP